MVKNYGIEEVIKIRAYCLFIDWSFSCYDSAFVKILWIA